MQGVAGPGEVVSAAGTGLACFPGRPVASGQGRHGPVCTVFAVVHPRVMGKVSRGLPSRGHVSTLAARVQTIE